jgi:quercetin dioxygenase-like cupin family protein
MRAFVFLATAISVIGVASSVRAQEARPDPPVLKEITAEFPKAEKLEARVLTATVQPGATSPWHTHSAPVAVYVLEGTFTLEFEGRDAVSKKQGEALLEPVNVKVRAANHGQVPAKVVIFQISDPAQPFLQPTK